MMGGMFGGRGRNNGDQNNNNNNNNNNHQQPQLQPQEEQHAPDMLGWYSDIPIVTRMYFTGAFVCTSLCAVDVLSPFYLYFNYDLVVHEHQVWRLVTSYLFFGVFSIDFMFHMYFLVRYSRLLEEGSDFRNGRTSNYILMLVFGIGNISLVATYTNVHFLGSALTFMMVYVWGRRNPDIKMSFLGFFTFNAPYLPWVMLGFSCLLGNGVTMDLIGIIVGHQYYYLEYIFPIVAEIRGFPFHRVLIPPFPLQWFLGEGKYNHNNQNVGDFGMGGAPPGMM